MSTWLAHSADGIQKAAAYLDTPDIPWKQLVVYLLWGVYLFETYIAVRQLRLYDMTTPPKALVPYVSMETFTKSQAYGRDKARFALVSDAVAHAYNLLAVYFDFYALAWVWATDILIFIGAPTNELTKSAMWVIVNTAMHELVSIPLSLYRNFVIEERHGFNKLDVKTYISDTVKEWIMGMLIGAPLVALAVWVIRWAGDYFVVYTVLFFTAIILFGTVLYPLVIQPLFNKLTPLPEGALRDRVVALASALHFPLKHLYVIDGSKRSSHSNAYFYGVIPGGSKHIVIYDTLIEKSTPAEIEAVLAHELGHWAHSDPTKLLVVSQLNLILMLSLFTLFIHNTSLFREFGFAMRAGPGIHVVEPYLPVMVGMELFQLVLNPSDAVLRFGINAIVRRMEYAADRFAAELPRAPKTQSELQAIRLIQSQGSGTEPTETPNPTVTDWVDRLSDVPAHRLPTEKIGEALPEDQELYSELLGRALVKLHIQK
ncbi:Ste24 endopeptidase [Malassezia psittaci]|uniref:CAAX prenyl protease n=1 Tax=Malassezia psittaci TaxID=1821823 RepID=A0AAF0JK37_9BASI|nr:Ste24 endopeptidase [Malassezia psittaci]